MLLFYGMPHGEVEVFALGQDTKVSEIGRRR